MLFLSFDCAGFVKFSGPVVSFLCARGCSASWLHTGSKCSMLFPINTKEKTSAGHQLGCVLPPALLLCWVPWRNEAVTIRVLVWQPEVWGCAVLLLVSVAQLAQLRAQLAQLWMAGWVICMPLVWTARWTPEEWGSPVPPDPAWNPAMGRQLYWNCWYQRELLAFTGAWIFQTICMALYLFSGMAAAQPGALTKKPQWWKL